MHRFANRIPLLFEGGSDVITKTALKRINWGTYKINQNTDKVYLGREGGKEEMRSPLQLAGAPAKLS